MINFLPPFSIPARSTAPGAAALVAAALLTLTSCGGRGNSDLDDADDRDDIVIDDFDDADDTTSSEGSRMVRRYTQGLDIPRDILDPKYLTRKNLARHLKSELATKGVEFNVNNRLSFGTRLFFPRLCLYRGVKLRQRIAFTYSYDTGVNERCRPAGDDIDGYAEWEKGEIEVSVRHQPKDGQDLADYWFELLEKIRKGEDVSIEHRYKRSVLMDYRDRGFELRKSQLTTQSTLDGGGCEYEFNSYGVGQEFGTCVRQTGVRIWNKVSGENKINDYVRLYNPDDLVADDTFEFQPWFNAGSGFDLKVNTWAGKLMFNQDITSKTTRPRAYLKDAKGNSFEFEPKPRPSAEGATIEVLRESLQR